MPEARSPALRRDTALRRSRSLTRWVAAIAVGLTAAFVGIAAQAFHGRTIKRAAASTPAARGSSATPGGSAVGPGTGTEAPPSANDGSGDPALQPPPAPPQPSQDPGATQSSGS